MIVFAFEHLRVLAESDKAQGSEKGEESAHREDFPKWEGLDLGPKHGEERKKVGFGLDISTRKVATSAPQGESGTLKIRGTGRHL